MYGNNIFSINLIAKHVNIENDAWGKHFYDKLCPQKFL